MSMRKFLSLFLVLSVAVGVAQVPKPAPAQQQAIILSGGTIHVGNGEVLTNQPNGTTYLRFEGGKITELGMVDRFDPKAAKIVDVTGKHI